MPHVQHYRIVANGTIYNEKVSFGLSMAGGVIEASDPANFATTTAVANACVTPFTTYLTAHANDWGNQVLWQGLRVTSYGPSGNIASVADKSFTTVIAGAGTVLAWPAIAVVVTQLTDRPGRSFRGRWYIPAMSLAIGSTASNGQLATAAVDLLTTRAQTLINSLNAATALDTVWAGMSVVVASAGKILSPGPPPTTGAGSVQNVTRVRINSLFDGQRRRQNQTPANYVKELAIT